MSVQNEIDRIITAVEAAHTKVAEKGGTTARPYLVGNLADAIGTIPEGSDPVLQEKTVSPSTSSQSVTPDSGYDGLSKVTVNAMPTATQATPSITVSSSGLITAKATQTAGYVSAGTKQATKQLTTQAAQTITPGTSNKTIASGRYLTGTQTIKGDSNLKAANIAKGVSIFGVTGTHEGGEDISAETAEYTAQLDELESTINSLPDAGSGGGGSVETCTVVLNNAQSLDRISYTSVVDGIFVANMVSSGNLYTITLENVLCGSVMVLADRLGRTPYCTNCETLISSDGADNRHIAISITAKSGETAVVTFSSQSSGGN